jgi:hypothetical protein
MRLLALIPAIALSVATPVFAQSMTSSRGGPNRLVGAWSLVYLEEPGADGQVRQADCTGMFVFSRSGKASVQVMYRNSQAGNSYAQSGYEASYGSYQIEAPHTFTFHIDGALVRTLIGKDLKRRFEIVGNQLTVTSTDPDEHWKVIWERH